MPEFGLTLGEGGGKVAGFVEGEELGEAGVGKTGVEIGQRPGVGGTDGGHFGLVGVGDEAFVEGLVGVVGRGEGGPGEGDFEALGKIGVLLECPDTRGDLTGVEVEASGVFGAENCERGEGGASVKTEFFDRQGLIIRRALLVGEGEVGR